MSTSNNTNKIEVKWKKGECIETTDDVYTMWETTICDLKIDMYKLGDSWVFGPKGHKIFKKILNDNHVLSYLGWTKKTATKSVISLVKTKLL